MVLGSHLRGGKEIGPGRRAGGQERAVRGLDAILLQLRPQLLLRVPARAAVQRFSKVLARNGDASWVRVILARPPQIMVTV